MNVFIRHRRSLISMAVFGMLLAAASPVLACPMCKAALASGDGGGDLVNGFFYSILFMLSMPVLIITGMGTYFYVLIRRARAVEAAKGSRQSLDAPAPGLIPAATMPESR